MKKDFVEYSIALQRAIESHCRGEIIPDDILVLCPHHGNMLNKAQNTIHNSDYAKKPSALEFARICTREGVDPMTSGLIYNLFFAYSQNVR